MTLSPQLADELRNQYGTGLYVYEESVMERVAKEVLGFGGPFGFRARYAMKANPIRAFLQYYYEKGIWIDASSGFEAQRAIAAGIAPEHILLTTQDCPDFLQELVDLGVEFNVCSPLQLERFIALEQRPESISLRINPGHGSGMFPGVNVGGDRSSFGIWHEQLPQIKEQIKGAGLRVHRVHTHIGSGSDPEVWKQVAIESVAYLREFPEAQILNLGGGFKVARVEGEKATSLPDVASVIHTVLAEFHEETGRKIQLEIEPGTYLSANTGGILSTVRDVVHTRDGNRFIKLDIGMDSILRPAMYGAQHPLELLVEDSEDRELLDYMVVGHCCESSDTLTVQADVRGQLNTRILPRTEINDLFWIGGTGAYCSSMAVHGYNSFPRLAEVMVHKDGSHRLIRRRQVVEEQWANEL